MFKATYMIQNNDAFIIKQVFIGILSFDGSLALECEILNNQPFCQLRPTLINVNSNETLYFRFVVRVKRCGESCNTTDDLHVQIYDSDKKALL